MKVKKNKATDYCKKLTKSKKQTLHFLKRTGQCSDANTSKNTSKNLVEDANDKQNVPVADFTNTLAKLKDLKHQTNEKINQSNEKLYNSEEKMDMNDNSTLITPVERNLGSPLVIDMLSDSVTSINLPQIFEQEQKTELSEEMTDNDILDMSEFLRGDASMIGAGSVNFQYNTDIQRHLKQSTPVPSSAAKSDKSQDADSDDRLRDINVCVNNVNSPIRSLRHKEYGRDRSSRSIDFDSDIEARGSPRHKNRGNSRQSTCKWKPTKVYCIKDMTIVKMESRSKFSFFGKLSVKVLYGAVKIYGFILDKSSGATKVYSPRGYSSVVIETNEEFPEDSVDDVWTALAPEGITRDSESKLQIDIDNVRPGEVVLVLRNFENKLTLFLKTYFVHFNLFSNRFQQNPSYIPWTDPRRAEMVLQAHLCIGQHNCKRLIIEPCITKDITERMLSHRYVNEWTCTLIAGGKNVGKSTSVRCLINSLLRTSKVVLLDLDPGQAECTPPGCISYSLIEEPLMGPNFTHLKTPVYQLFIDEVNISQCITRYLEGIKMLIERLKECPELSRLPVVVNTMGFTKNLGWDIMIFTIKLIRPSIILQITSRETKNNYGDFLSAEVVNKQECSFTFYHENFVDWNRPCEHDLCIIYSQAETERRRPTDDSAQWKRKMEPYQQRELAMMSYFTGQIDDKNPLYSNQINMRPSLNIYKAVPYTAPFSSLCIIPQRSSGVPASHALSVINGNIVALCGIDLTEESSQESESISSLRVLTQRSPLCTCYGFGIIRGVDMERQEVYINTPLPISIMQHVNCLAGCTPVPPALLQLHQGAPYVGGDATLPTSREPRRGYFRMRYQNKPNKS